MNLKRIDSLQFDPGSHTYRDLNCQKSLVSVSKVLSSLKEEFDEDRMSFMVAKKRGVPQEVILQEWATTRNRSTDYGTCLHEAMEHASQFHTAIEFDYHGTFEALRKIRGLDFTATWQEFWNAILWLQATMYQYPVAFAEFRIFDPTSAICGTMDLVCQRSKARGESNGVTVDIKDFKTNIENGILFDSIKRANGVIVKDYNRRMNFPVEHLEDCNYNHYALQLSLYALMIELWFKVKIGRLTILYISLQMQWTEYPVPYMRSEAMDIMKYVSGQRSLEEPIQLATVVEGDDW